MQRCGSQTRSLPSAFTRLPVSVAELGGGQAKAGRPGAGGPQAWTGRGRFLGFWPHSVTLFQGLTARVSFEKLKTRLLIPFYVEIYFGNS